MASKNEKRAAELGMSLKEYKKTAEYKAKKANEKSKDKAVDKIEDYYSERKKRTKETAKRATKRLEQDLKTLLKDAGIAEDRAIEDYLRNIRNLEENKAADIDDLNYYVGTQTERTQEDLDVSLAKELRRHSLERDKISQNLADAGLTFSERKDERIAKEESDIAREDIQRKARRSFDDIARYQATLNRDIEMKYGQQTEEVETEKKRSVEDILNRKREQQQKIQRAKEDVAFGKAHDLRELEYGEDTDVATTKQLFENQNVYERANYEMYG